MKLYLLFAFFSTLPVIMAGQTAEEILTNSESAYHKLHNYVDQGTLVPEYRSMPVPMDTSSYYVAMDRKGNVSYRLNKTHAGNTSGAGFTKTSKDSTGMYTRLGSEDAPFACGLEEALARLMGSGGSMFYLIGSMFYEDTSPDNQIPTSMIQHFDTAKRLDDTTIHGALCYVVKTRKTIIISQELADEQNFKRDSTQGLLTLPPEQRGGPRTEAGPKTNERKYFFRQSDLMLIRMEEFHFKDDTNFIKHRSTLVLNPRYNVKDFAKYLKE